MYRSRKIHITEKLQWTLEIITPNILSSFYGWGHGYTEMLSDLAQVIQYVGGALGLNPNPHVSKFSAPSATPLPLLGLKRSGGWWRWEVDTRQRRLQLSRAKGGAQERRKGKKKGGGGEAKKRQLMPKAGDLLQKSTSYLNFQRIWDAVCY